MAKLNINFRKYHRALLSEVLPFELPIIFNNDGFFLLHEHQDKKSLIHDLYKKIFCDHHVISQSIPYSYTVYKTENSVRHISIPHPRIQIQACQFLEKYDSLLIKLLTKGQETSLRYPHKISSTVYENNRLEKKYKFKSGQIIENNDDKTTQYYVSYFSYNYSRIYQYYNSNEFLEFEKKFKHLWITDIANCFDSIYTHSISWSITKNRAYAKKHTSNASIFNKFDKLMQRSNYNETNGIIIGWEISRIFSEVILQEIDRKVISLLEEKNLSFGNDYIFKRYVDDYFIYGNDVYKLEVIHSVLSSILHDFKLNLNENKFTKLTRPFVTPQSIAVENLFSILDNFKKEIYEERKFFNSNLKMKALIRNIKIIAQSQEANYSNIINLAVNKICNDSLQALLSKKNQFKDRNNLLNSILLYMKVAAYLISIAPHVRACNKFLLLCQQSLEFSSEEDFDRVDDFKNEIFLLLKELSKSNRNNNKNYLNNLNFLVGLTILQDDYKLSGNDIKNIFSNEGFASLNYLEIISIIFYIKNDSEYLEIHRAVQKNIQSKLEKITKESLLENTHDILLVLDCLSCPYLDIALRKEIATKLNVFFKFTLKNIQNMSESDFAIFNHNWFVNWDDFSFLRTLVKQQLYSKNKMVYTFSAE